MYGAMVPDGLFKDLIGKTEEEAVSAIKAQHFTYRIVQRDDERFMGTCDMNPFRANLVIKAGKLAGVTWG